MSTVGGIEPGGLPSRHRQAMRTLALNGLMVRVAGALEAAQIPTLAIKGPVNREWLYAGSAQRTYSDVDLLIAPGDRAGARQVLSALGMVDHHAAVLGVYRPLHEEAWLAEEGVVDLHWSVAGIPPQSWAAAWAVLGAHREELALGGRTVHTPDEVGRCLLLGLHAAQSVRSDTSRADLRVALGRVPEAAWSEALANAVGLHCDGAFVSGLSAEPTGREMLDRLARLPRRSLISHLYDQGVPYRVTLWAARTEAMLHPTTVAPVRLMALTDGGQPVLRRMRIRVFGGAQALRGLIEYAVAALRWSVVRGSGRADRPFSEC